jgi:putative FmdB family regulatory protein
VPTYQYACTECGHGFETFQSFTDDALTECPACSGRLRKVFNSVGVVFKGSGFYRTDSREATKGKDATSKDGGDKPAEKKSEKPKSESAPAAAGTSTTSSSRSSSTGSSSDSGSSTKGSAA